jgi:hypothetical protein
MTEETTTTQEQTTQEQTTPETDSQSLLGETTGTPEVKDTPEQAVDSTDSDRPSWLPEKFKTPEDFAKSYSELETKIADAKPKVPNEYDYSFAKDMGLDMNTDQQKEASDIFKNYGLTQEQAKGMLALYSDSIKSFAEQYTANEVKIDTDMEQQTIKDKWGNDYTNRLAQLKNFSNNINRDTLNAPMANTAEGLQILYDAMQYRQGVNPITDAPASQVSQVGIREKIMEMRNDARYSLPQGDPVGDAFRAEIYRQYQQLDRIKKPE